MISTKKDFSLGCREGHFDLAVPKRGLTNRNGDQESSPRQFTTHYQRLTAIIGSNKLARRQVLMDRRRCFSSSAHGENDGGTAGDNISSGKHAFF